MQQQQQQQSQEDASVDPDGGGAVLSRAAELGVLSLLGSASEAGRPVSLEELSANAATTQKGSSGGNDGSSLVVSDLEAVMGALVELKVVAEETEDAERKAYRLLRPPETLPMPPGSDSVPIINAAPGGTEQSVGAHHQGYGDAIDGGAKATSPYHHHQGLQEGSMEQHSTMIPYTEAQIQAQQQAIAYAQQMGYASGSMYPMYPVYGSPPPQYYPPGASGSPHGAANAAAEGQPNFGGFHSPVAVPSGGYMYGAMPMPGADGIVSPTWVPQGSGGSFTGVPPPPPPPRGDSASSPSATSHGWPHSLDEPADLPPQPSSSGKPPCAFFLKTGTCAYGDKCKFEHPAGRQPPRLNSMGYPVRPGESDCVYFIKRGMCGFGITCKFNHPEINPRSQGAAVQQGQGPAAAAAAAAAAAQWQQHMMQPGMMQPGMMQYAGPAGMMQGPAGMMPMMPYMARAHTAGGSQGPGGQPGYPPAVMPGPSPPVMMVPVPSLGGALQQQQQDGKPIVHAASAAAPSGGAPNKGPNNNNNNINSSALGSSPTQHLHEILGISPSPSLASSDGVGIPGGVVSGGSWSDSAMHLGSSSGSASTHMSMQSGEHMHWEMQHSQRQQQGHPGRGGRRRGGKQKAAAPPGAAPGDIKSSSSSKPEKPSTPLSASAAAAAAAAAKESLSPTKKSAAAAAAAASEPQQQPSTPAAAAAEGASGGSPSYSPGFGSPGQLPAAVSTPVTATS